MKITYKPLWQLIFNRHLKLKDVLKDAHISSSTCQKLRNDENITTDILVRLCNTLECDLSDIVKLEKKDTK